jgi:hypothetical protein
MTQDETFTGGLCLVGIEPVSNYILLEQAAATRDHDTWHALMAQALAGLNCHVIQSTSDEAPGLLAYVEQHLRAHHSPDLFHVQQELSTAVAAAGPNRGRWPERLRSHRRTTREKCQALDPYLVTRRCETWSAACVSVRLRQARYIPPV